MEGEAAAGACGEWTKRVTTAASQQPVAFARLVTAHGRNLQHVHLSPRNTQNSRHHRADNATCTPQVGPSGPIDLDQRHRPQARYDAPLAVRTKSCNCPPWVSLSRYAALPAWGLCGVPSLPVERSVWMA